MIQMIVNSTFHLQPIQFRIEATIYEHTQMLDELLYKAITINNFSISKSTAELGEKLIGLILNWSYNKTPTYQKLDNVLIDTE